jgi:hypothetical protein
MKLMFAADTQASWKHTLALLGLAVLGAPSCTLFAPPRAPPIAKQIDGDFSSPLTPDLLLAVDAYRAAVKRVGWPAKLLWAGVAANDYDIDRSPIGIPIMKSAKAFLVVQFPATGHCWISGHGQSGSWATYLERKSDGGSGYGAPILETNIGWDETKNDTLANSLATGYVAVDCAALDSVKGGTHFAPDGSVVTASP